MQRVCLCACVPLDHGEHQPTKVLMAITAPILTKSVMRQNKSSDTDTSVVALAPLTVTPVWRSIVRTRARRGPRASAYASTMCKV